MIFDDFHFLGDLQSSLKRYKLAYEVFPFNHSKSLAPSAFSLSRIGFGVRRILDPAHQPQLISPLHLRESLASYPAHTTDRDKWRYGTPSPSGLKPSEESISSGRDHTDFSLCYGVVGKLILLIGTTTTPRRSRSGLLQHLRS